MIFGYCSVQKYFYKNLVLPLKNYNQTYMFSGASVLRLDLKNCHVSEIDKCKLSIKLKFVNFLGIDWNKSFNVWQVNDNMYLDLQEYTPEPWTRKLTMSEIPSKHSNNYKVNCKLFSCLHLEIFKRYTVVEDRFSAEYAIWLLLKHPRSSERAQLL